MLDVNGDRYKARLLRDSQPPRVFKTIELNEIFDYNGIEWTKRSTRTARSNSTGDLLYFGQNDVLIPYITIGEYIT